jgi:hypothetical protein
MVPTALLNDGLMDISYTYDTPSICEALKILEGSFNGGTQLYRDDMAFYRGTSSTFTN